MPIVWSIVVLGGLGAVFGAVLGYASKAFAVKKDEREELILTLLPGANCGGCGYPGCGGLATAIVEKKAQVTDCAVVSAENAQQIAQVMGVALDASEPKIARIKCLGSHGNCKNRFEYDGAKDCREAYAQAGGFKACRFACLGLGTCAKVCKFDAITMGEDGIAAIDPDRCTGCSRCVEECPQESIQVFARSMPVHVGCTNQYKGKAVIQNCTAGCIGCAACARVCPFDAIVMENNLPVFDPKKCRNCQECVRACPRKCIIATKPPQVAVIDDEKCKGCGLCEKACRFDAVTGERRHPYTVHEDECVGCGMCKEACRFDAITMKDAPDTAAEERAS